MLNLNTCRCESDTNIAIQLEELFRLTVAPSRGGKAKGLFPSFAGVTFPNGVEILVYKAAVGAEVLFVNGLSHLYCYLEWVQNKWEEHLYDSEQKRYHTRAQLQRMDVEFTRIDWIGRMRCLLFGPLYICVDSIDGFTRPVLPKRLVCDQCAHAQDGHVSMEHPWSECEVCRCKVVPRGRLLVTDPVIVSIFKQVFGKNIRNIQASEFLNICNEFRGEDQLYVFSEKLLFSE